MNKIAELRQKKAAAIKRMRELLDLAETEKRELKDEEKAEYEGLDKSIDSIDESIAKEERLIIREEEMRKIINPLPPNVPGDRKIVTDHWRNLGEFVRDVAINPNAKHMQEYREQTMGDGKQGGFALPEQFRPTVLQVRPQEAAIRPRATIIEPGDPPDAKITMPALDQSSAENVYGGVVITHTGEGKTMTETDVAFKDISWEPKELSAYIVATNKLLQNWTGASGLLETQLRKAMIGAEDYDFTRGDGINKALGFINSGAAIEYTRVGANAISFSDIYGMVARLKMGGSPVWLASQTVIPQLAAMVDAGSHSVWLGGALMGSAKEAMPSTLFGIPVVFFDRLPALGTKGDLNLVDLSYYVIKDGSGPYISWSEHVYWTSNKSAVKVVWNVDGKPWLTEPIGLEGATSNTVSPFVILK